MELETVGGSDRLNMIDGCETEMKYDIVLVAELTNHLSSSRL